MVFKKPKVIPKSDPCPITYTVAIPSDMTPLDLYVQRARGAIDMCIMANPEQTGGNNRGNCHPRMMARGHHHLPLRLPLLYAGK